jgi:hypothetical protein
MPTFVQQETPKQKKNESIIHGLQGTGNAGNGREIDEDVFGSLGLWALKGQGQGEGMEMPI